MKTAIERAHEAAARAEYEHGDEYYGTWDTLDASLKEYAIQKARAANLAFLSSCGGGGRSALRNQAVDQLARLSRRTCHVLAGSQRL